MTDVSSNFPVPSIAYDTLAVNSILIALALFLIGLSVWVAYYYRNG